MPIARIAIGESGFATGGALLSFGMVSRESAATDLGSDPDDVAESLVRMLAARELLSGAA
jgi:hypothetical protein